MNAFVCIVLASASIVTVKAIKRIPINLSNQENDKVHFSEDLRGTDSGEDKRTLNLIDVDSDKNAVDSNKNTTGDMKLTEFILEAAKVLKTYENYDLEEAFVILDHAVWENMYKGCQLVRLTQELADIRRYVSKQLRLLKDEPADTLRQYLDNTIDIISNENYGEVREFVSFINSLYVGEHAKFVEVLLALVHKRIYAGIKLEGILKYALSLIFDHYCKLNSIDRHELIKMIKHYWKQFISQVDDYKVGRSINTLPLVTPFIYERRSGQNPKKKRFNTIRINKGCRLNKNDSNYSDENIHKVRADSEEITNTTQKHELNNSDENVRKEKMRAYSEEISSESTKEASANNDLGVTNKTAVVVGGGEILKTITIDALKPALVHITKRIPEPEPERSAIDAFTSITPLVFRQSNKTIEKLIKIGTLAKEINDMIALEGESFRSKPNTQSLTSMLGMQVLQIMGDYGDMSTAADMVKADEGGEKKDILISMKAKYQE